jgi:hypothetical protein
MTQCAAANARRTDGPMHIQFSVYTGDTSASCFARPCPGHSRVTNPPQVHALAGALVVPYLGVASMAAAAALSAYLQSPPSLQPPAAAAPGPASIAVPFAHTAAVPPAARGLPPPPPPPRQPAGAKPGAGAWRPPWRSAPGGNGASSGRAAGAAQPGRVPAKPHPGPIVPAKPHPGPIVPRALAATGGGPRPLPVPRGLVGRRACTRRELGRWARGDAGARGAAGAWQRLPLSGVRRCGGAATGVQARSVPPAC